MKQIVLKAGLIAGGILAAVMAVSVPLGMEGVIDYFEYGALLGYSTMVLSFLMVFFGIRSYREEVGKGAISFGRAFQVGILITLTACAIYVLTWEVIYWGFYPDFMERYSDHTLAKMRAASESAAAIGAMGEQMATFSRLYRNPLFNVAITFLEVFPVGLIVTLISAAILRRREGAATSRVVAA
jgi:hypothetical protein